MSQYRKDARAMRKARLDRMLAADNPVAKEATAYATLGDNLHAQQEQKIKTRATGGRVKNNDHDKDDVAAPRLDRRARGGKVKGKTVVNVNVMQPSGDDKAAVPLPIPVPAGGPGPMPPKPPMMPPAGGPPVPGPMPGAPGLPVRKRGGAVKMTAGSLSGPGRLQKTKMQKRSYP